MAENKFNEGDQVWYVDEGNYHWGIPTVHSENITVVMLDGKYYGFGALLAREASLVFDNPEEAQAKVKEILGVKITRAENKLKEIREVLAKLK